MNTIERLIALNGGSGVADWLTHSLLGWIIGKTTKQDVAILVIGALIPDLVKISLAFQWFNINDYGFFDPLHTPVGAFLVAGIIALFFQDIRKTFLMLIIGVGSHFLLDFFLVHVHSGMVLLFPFSWDQWQLYLIRNDDYRMTIVAILAALLVYGCFWFYEKRKKTKDSQQPNNGSISQKKA